MASSVFYSHDLHLRTISEPDLEILERHRNDPSTWGNLTSPIPVLPNRQKQWLDSLGKDSYYFIINTAPKDLPIEHGSDVGLSRITDIDWVNRSAAVGIDIFVEHRGQFLAKPSFRATTKYAFEVLNMHRLWLMVLDSNAKAIHVYEDAGFLFEGRMRKHIFRNNEWHDYILMGMLKDEYDSTI